MAVSLVFDGKLSVAELENKIDNCQKNKLKRLLNDYTAKFKRSVRVTRL
ncbi:hypothetical protein HFN_0073 [Helicobacter fennelliae MRY12-0050]|uniref:Uncharacterized protein n=1 Tax=Helicobacter fennelliae MRY12-0050 TaxID=1325130 RepID=T1DVY5_9HELI|nr:hypothetical protein HFN_0073 [Helicobacter fennelliae MRY12-0050]